MLVYGLQITKVGRWGNREQHYKLFHSKADREKYLQRYGGTIRYIKSKKFTGNINIEEEEEF